MDKKYSLGARLLLELIVRGVEMKKVFFDHRRFLVYVAIGSSIGKGFTSTVGIIRINRLIKPQGRLVDRALDSSKADLVWSKTF